MINVRKAAVIGCGFVGSSIAFSLMQRGLYSQLVLIDANQAKAEGEAMDLSHGLPYAASMQIYAGTYDDVADCAMVILTAGASQKPGESRLDLIDKNVAILKSIIPELTRRKFQGILLVVSNPVDVLTYAAWRLSGLPARHVIGSGTVLDTARLKYLLGQELGVDSRNVHAAVIGEHGDSELAVWSSANISSLDLDRFCQLRGKEDYRAVLERIYREVRDSAYEIIARKGATYYGIAMAVARIAECIAKNESAMLPVSAVLEGQYGLSGLCLSIPTIVGQDGAETVLEIPLSPRERAALLSSAPAFAAPRLAAPAPARLGHRKAGEGYIPLLPLVGAVVKDLQEREGEVPDVLWDLIHQNARPLLPYGQLVALRELHLAEDLLRERPLVLSVLPPVELKVGIEHGDRLVKAVLQGQLHYHQPASLRGRPPLVGIRRLRPGHRIVKPGGGYHISHLGLLGVGMLHPGERAAACEHRGGQTPQRAKFQPSHGLPPFPVRGPDGPLSPPLYGDGIRKQAHSGGRGNFSPPPRRLSSDGGPQRQRATKSGCTWIFAGQTGGGVLR